MDYSKNIKSSCLETDADYFRSAKMTIQKGILKKKKKISIKHLKRRPMIL